MDLSAIHWKIFSAAWYELDAPRVGSYVDFSYTLPHALSLGGYAVVGDTRGV
jgi:hypothetical protein